MRIAKRERVLPISIYEIDPNEDVRFRLDHNDVEIARSAAPLGAVAEYNTGAFDTRGYQRITGIVIADQDGTLFVEHSNDGTNWDSVSQTSYFANDTASFAFEPRGPSCRIRFVNGSTPQTTFRISVLGAY